MTAYILFLLAAVVAVSGRFEFTEEWELWKKEHGKAYSSEEEEFQRHVVWESNRFYVDSHNDKRADKLGFTLKMNQYADLESGEFAKLYAGAGYTKEDDYGYEFGNSEFTSSLSAEDLPEAIDWREKGYVTKVKNQGWWCASGWAFSATGSLEGQHYNKTGKLVSLSEQNLMDCSMPQGNWGCRGGRVDQAFEYIIKNDGIDYGLVYPYVGFRLPICRYLRLLRAATMSDYKTIASGNETDLQAAVATIGPISVTIDASRRTFQLYHEGVYYEPECSDTKVKHAVLIVGYGTEEKVRNGTKCCNDHWIVKNSWGAKWGMGGYIKMSRNEDNNCGIATDAVYPIV